MIEPIYEFVIGGLFGLCFGLLIWIFTIVLNERKEKEGIME